MLYRLAIKYHGDPNNLPMMQCKCSSPGYCDSLGRQMNAARFNECHNNTAFCEMFHREAESGKYKAEQYQKPYDGNAPTPTITLSAAQKARNFIRAIPRIIAGQRTTAEQRAARLSICANCEFVTGNGCQLCGCRLQLKTKLAGESCPVLKWPGDRERFEENR